MGPTDKNILSTAHIPDHLRCLLVDCEFPQHSSVSSVDTASISTIQARRRFVKSDIASYYDPGYRIRDLVTDDSEGQDVG
ncbi:hypothetical protein FRC12_002681 [Ceratobasidium sp. 428]|nr:hypothetical protein FRC12_002681 [Ceratobasidium sp. 428]